MRRIAVAALLLSAAGCLREPDPFAYQEPALSVHGLVRAGDAGASVSLLRTLDGGGRGNEGVAGAEVSLAGGAASVALRPATGPEAGCYVDHWGGQELGGCYRGQFPRAPEPGSRWTLTVRLPDGETATGTAVVPLPPTLVQPAHRARVTFRADQAGVEGEGGALRVEWQTDGAPRVEFRLGEGVAFRNGVRVDGSRCMVLQRDPGVVVGQPAGSRTLRVDDAYCYQDQGTPLQWDSAAVPLLATAYDSAYADFALRGTSVSRSRSAALQGAYGVFGAAATTRREIILIPQR